MRSEFIFSKSDLIFRKCESLRLKLSLVSHKNQIKRVFLLVYFVLCEFTYASKFLLYFFMAFIHEL